MKIFANFRIWYVLDTPISLISAVDCTDTLSGPLMSLQPARNMSLGRGLLVARFSSVKNHNVSGPQLFPKFTTHAKKIALTPRTVLHRAKKSLCNRSQFWTLFLPIYHDLSFPSATRQHWISHNLLDSRISQNESKTKKLQKRLNSTKKNLCSAKEPWASQKEFWNEGLLDGSGGKRSLNIFILRVG